MQLLRDENGKTSSTRMILMVALTLFSLIALVDLIWAVEYSSHILTIIEYIFMLGLGGNAIRASISNYRVEYKE